MLQEQQWILESFMTLVPESVKMMQMLRQNLEIFYYEDTNLQPVSSHRHEHYEVYFFLSGPVNCLIDDKNYPLAPGDICLIPPGIYHRPAFRNEKETYRRIVLWISADYLNQLKRTHSQIDYCFQLALNKKQYHFRNDSGTAQILFGKLFDLLEEYHSSGAFHEQLLTCYTGAFLLQLNRIVSEYSSPSAYRKRIPAQVWDALVTLTSAEMR